MRIELFVVVSYEPQIKKDPAIARSSGTDQTLLLANTPLTLGVISCLK